MNIKPWREIARPHKDVLQGAFKQSEFAADISLVAGGAAPPEYQDAEKFFARTFITEGMRLLLISVARRVAGQGGDPVIQLQTAFGGGKTHTMLAVYHLASRTVSHDKLAGVPPVLDEARIHELPFARVAVIDGIRLSPSQPVTHGRLSINTLWGNLAHQLLGEAGYDIVSESDRDGTSPGKGILSDLIRQASPCVILIDELVAFMRQLEVGKTFRAGTFDSNLSFIQALTEALKSVPNAVLLATLPESELEIGGAMGQRTLTALEKYFARVESVWKPVAVEEAFEIVRRRLFDTVGDSSEMDAVCRSFADFYREHHDKFPLETQTGSYYDRLRASYPIHPEIFDRLYEDWSTLEKFQRTRGVLQYMATVIHRLWNSDNRDLLIMPGSLPLEDATVRTKSIHYLPQGWEPIIESEVDGPRSEPFGIDGRDTRFGGVQAARRNARTIFLGSAPSASGQMVRGIQTNRILLGTVQPGQSVGIFEDALKRLRDRLHYLYSEKDRFWLDTKPNLRREMESRKQNFSDRDEIQPLLKERITRIIGRNHRFAGVHVFTPSSDIPDDYGNGPRLVVLPPLPTAGFRKGGSPGAFSAAEQILRNRGDQPRQKQNRLIFLAADEDVLGRLKDAARTYLAWESILVDIENEKLNLDLFQIKQTTTYCDAAENALSRLVRETYKWLICPVEEFERGKPKLKWEDASVSSSAKHFAQEIESRLIEEEWVIYQWSPIHLRNLLNRWYFKDGIQEVGALKVWRDCCHFLYLPRIINEALFKDTICLGLESEDFFGYAAGREGSRYLGFVFGGSAAIVLDENDLLIERETAAAYKSHRQTEGVDISETGNEVRNDSLMDKPQAADHSAGIGSEGNISSTLSIQKKKRFYATVDLDPIKAKMDFATITDEILEHFTARTGVEVTVSVEIRAETEEGFDESIQRTIKENCNVLRFRNTEFE